MLTRRSPWCLIDADDTILGVEIEGKAYGTAYAYTYALERFQDAMEVPGFARDYALATQRDVDSKRAKELGFGDKSRFPVSLRLTYERLCAERGLAYSTSLAEQAEAIGWQVFTHPYVALPNAISVMAELHKHYNIAVVTKGEVEEQRKKVFESGCFVYADQTIVLDHKSLEEWEQTCDALAIGLTTRNRSWAIGNSVKSDINPPLALGFNAIHLNAPHSWIFESAEYSAPLFRRRLEIVSDIRDVLKFALPTTADIQE